MAGAITAVVLAAGAAERMGEPKLLLPFRGTTILNATIAAVEASSVDRVAVVTGANAASVEGSIASGRAVIVRNPDYRRGNMSSFLTAVAADPEAAAFILVPGDVPEIRTDVIDAMATEWRDREPWAAVAAYSDRMAHPFLVSIAAVTELGGTSGQKVLGRLLLECSDDRVARVDVPYVAPRDVNTPEDYAGLTGA
jgi:molybdenum cofactor cytidylyltransferase